METQLGFFAATASDGHWRPGIGDPTVVGWFTVVAYLLTAALCARAALAERRPEARADKKGPPRPSGEFARWLALAERRPEARADKEAASNRSAGSAFWWTLTSILIILGINKQLDLQTALTDLGRSLARAQDWYAARHSVQQAFIATIAAIGSIGLVTFSWLFRRDAARYRLAITGLVFLLAFVTIRAASFHHVDAFINRRSFGLKWNWILELGGIAMIAASTVSRLRSPRGPGAG